MRIIAGRWRGRALSAPDGSATRPTSDRAREGLFSMLQSRLGSFDGLGVADLFAGTGSLGLEALSRGAASCLFVENNRAALNCLRRNIDALGAGAQSDIRHGPVEHLAPPLRPLDLIFIDPPWQESLEDDTLARVASPAWIAPGGWVSLESARKSVEAPSGLALVVERQFGRARLRLYQAEAVPASPSRQS